MTRSKKLGSWSPGSRELFGLCIVAGIAFMSWTMMGPLVPLLLLDLKATPSLLGIVLSVSTVGSLLIAVPGGHLAKYWGTRKLMFRAGLISVLSALFLAAFPTVLGLFIGLVILEIGKILFIIGAQAHVSTLGEGRDLSLDFGWYGTAVAIGQMLGPLIAGLVIDHAGHQITWIVIAAFGVLMIAILPRILSPGTVDPAETEDPAQEKRKKNLRYYLNTYAVIAILASFAVIFADGARTTFFPVLLNDFGYSATVIGFFLSLRGLVSMSVRFFMGRLVKFLGGRFPALLFAIFIMAVGIATTPFCKGLVLLSASAILIGIGIGLALPLSMATVSEGVDPEDRGVAMGIRLTGNRLAQVINPVCFGLVAESFGLSISFIAGGVLLFLTGLPIALWWRGESKRFRDSDSGQGKGQQER